MTQGRYEQAAQKIMRIVIDQAVKSAGTDGKPGMFKRGIETAKRMVAGPKPPKDWKHRPAQWNTSNRPMPGSHGPGKIVKEIGKTAGGLVIPKTAFDIMTGILNGMLWVTGKDQTRRRDNWLMNNARKFAFSRDGSEIKELWGTDAKVEYVKKFGFSRLEEQLKIFERSKKDIASLNLKKRIEAGDQMEWIKHVYASAYIANFGMRMKRELSILQSIVDDYNKAIDPMIREIQDNMKSLLQWYAKHIEQEYKMRQKT